MSRTILHQQSLDNGLELTFIDLSNRYYGDFHQIKIDIVSRISLSNELLSESGLTEREQLQAKNRFGEALETHREIKRMGVAGSEVTAVTKQMVQQFLDTALSYMATTDFPSSMLRQKLAEQSSLRSIHG